MKERRDLRDVEREREEEKGEEEVVRHRSSRHKRGHGVWQLKEAAEHDSREGFPPVFKTKIHDKAYNVGDSCTMSVRILAKPAPTVSWYRNDEHLTDGGRVRTTKSEDGRYSLTILSTKPHDFGVYKCVARNRYGTVTCRARMHCGNHPDRPGRPHVTQVSDTEAFMIWEEPETDGNSYILAYRLDWIKPGDERWTTATYCIDECALVKGLKANTSYRFRVSAINKFGISPYSFGSVEIRTLKSGAAAINIDTETRSILTRSRQATSRPSPEPSPVSSPYGSMEDLTAIADAKKDFGLLDREIHLQEGVNPEDFMAFGSIVWKGRFTLVRNVKPKEGKKVKLIAKIIPYDAGKAEESLREYEMLKSVRQENIVRLHEAYVHNECVFLVLEKLYGENVARSLSLKNKYTEHQVSSIIKQVLDGLQFLHHRGIVHLNVQPDNVVMLSRRRFDVKLIDFGRARKVTTYEGDKYTGERDGTAEFMAPEKVNREVVGVPADIWGVGTLAFILLSGVSPFRGVEDTETFANISTVRYDAHALYHNCTKYALKFIYQILKRNPTARLTTEECLEHKWLMLNAPLIKARKAAVFPAERLKVFEEQYIARRRLGTQISEHLLASYGQGEAFSSDDEEDIFAGRVQW
jgi:serine/threonine protein kinase